MENEGLFRLVFFVGGLTVFSLMPLWIPRRQFQNATWQRWLTNIGLTLFNSLAVRVCIPVMAVQVAAWAESQSIGLLQQMNQPILAGVLGFLLLDMIIYFQHRVFHTVPTLWRLHRLHHSDVMFDASTALRFHPIEILVSMVIKIGFVLLLGVPALAVVVFEITLNFSAMFNHANMNLGKLDGLLKRVLVTPDMHRIHHSVIEKETNSNYGFFLSIWDRIFGSFTEEPKHGQVDMQIGLYEFRDPADQTIGRLLMQPIR